MIIAGIIANILYEVQHIPNVLGYGFFASIGIAFQHLANLINIIAAS